MNHDEWVAKTTTIREWLKGGAVSTAMLAAELDYWAAAMTPDPSEFAIYDRRDAELRESSP